MGSDERYLNEVSETSKLLRTLSNPVRRQIIKFFEEKTETKSVSLKVLCNHLNRRLPGKVEEGIRMSLSQNHLPTLDSRGWLTYDEETSLITYHGHDEAVECLQELLHIFTEQEC